MSPLDRIQLAGHHVNMLYLIAFYLYATIPFVYRDIWNRLELIGPRDRWSLDGARRHAHIKFIVFILVSDPRMCAYCQIRRHFECRNRVVLLYQCCIIIRLGWPLSKRATYRMHSQYHNIRNLPEIKKNIRLFSVTDTGDICNRNTKGMTNVKGNQILNRKICFLALRKYVLSFKYRYVALLVLEQKME